MSGIERSKRSRELGMRALEAWDRDDIKTCKQMVNEALSIRPDQPHANCALGLIMMREGQTRAAMEPLNKYIAGDGRTDYRGYEAVGDVSTRSNAPNLAVNYYKKALEFAPARAGTRNVRADIQMKYATCLGQIGRYKEALDMAKEAIAALPRKPEYQWDLSKIHIKARNDEEALQAIDAAVKMVRDDLMNIYAQEVTDVTPLSKKLMLLDEMLKTATTLLQGRLEKATTNQIAIVIDMARYITEQAENDRQIKLVTAITLLSQGLSYDMNHAEMWAQLAQCELTAGLRVNSVRSVEKALELDSNNATARNVKARLESVAPAAAAAAP